MMDVYRSCASIAVLRPAEQCSPTACMPTFEMLLLHKPRKNDAWQLPQGGREKGETIEQAAVRELQEEAGITATVLGKSEHVYQYQFPASYRRFRPDNVCGQRVEFIMALVDASTHVQVDNREIDAFVWVKPSELSQYLKRVEYRKIAQAVMEEATRFSSQR
ncbi:MAG: NUDIX hydrolase [Candidatus Peribacteraceae bacterium]|nr:NUDIX hydrolase [Candidatus Peribacteraceae bacterium]